MSDKVTQLHTPRNVPPPELSTIDKMIARSKGIGRLDHIRHLLTETAKDFRDSGDEGTKDATVELGAEVEALLEGLAVGR